MHEQRYITDELTHFVGRREKNDQDKFDLLVHVIKSGWILHSPFDPNIESGMVTEYPGPSLEEMIRPDITCFADIPISDLAIHMNKYSRFGVSFKREFLTKNGASPVFYIANDAIRNSGHTFGEDYFEGIKLYYDFIMPQFRYLRDELNAEDEANKAETLTKLNQLLEVDAFIARIFAYLKPFDANKQFNDPDNYYMEREWRIMGKLKFTLNDVHRILIPKEFAKKIRTELPEYFGQITFTD